MVLLVRAKYPFASSVRGRKSQKSKAIYRISSQSALTATEMAASADLNCHSLTTCLNGSLQLDNS